MRKIVAWVVVLLVVLLVGVALADRSLKQMFSLRGPFRLYTAGVAPQYDTLAVVPGERIELQTFTMFADDSAQATGLTATLMSLNSKTIYGRFNDSYTASQLKTFTFSGPLVFPKDTTVLIYYNMPSAGALDTLMVQATYKLERP